MPRQHYHVFYEKVASQEQDGCVGHQILLTLLNDIRGMDPQINGVLVNRYRDGCDYISKHSDKGVLPEERVFSVSFGQIRTFRIRDRSNKIICNVSHEHGMLLCMDGNFQERFTHEVPVEKKIKKPRISLTFRHHQHD